MWCDFAHLRGDCEVTSLDPGMVMMDEKDHDAGRHMQPVSELTVAANPLPEEQTHTINIDTYPPC